MNARRVMGIETEYGISVPGHPNANAMLTSSQIVNAYAAAMHRARRARWDFEEENPLRDARGFDLAREAADSSQLTGVKADSQGGLVFTQWHNRMDWNTGVQRLLDNVLKTLTATSLMGLSGAMLMGVVGALMYEFGGHAIFHCGELEPGIWIAEIRLPKLQDAREPRTDRTRNPATDCPACRDDGCTDSR